MRHSLHIGHLHTSMQRRRNQQPLAALGQISKSTVQALPMQLLHYKVRSAVCHVPEV